MGKAQEVCSTLSVEQSLNYNTVKATVLRAYELVPEAYRQKFRAHVKTANQTYVEFAHEKRALLEKWLYASKISDLEQLKELILLEAFKDCVSESIGVYLNERKVTSVADAVVFSDEFVLTHKTEFSPSLGRDKSDSRVCFYCLDPGHLIADCKAWQTKKPSKRSGGPKNVGFVQKAVGPRADFGSADPSYEPFSLKGFVSFDSDSADWTAVTILRDTRAAQSVILDSALNFSDASSCGVSVLVRGMELGCMKVPLHTVYLRSGLVSGRVELGVCSKLPVDGVTLLLGNDLAGGKVFPLPVVIDSPEEPLSDSSELFQKCPTLFPACAVTRAQSRKLHNDFNLAETFMFSPQAVVECEIKSPILNAEVSSNAEENGSFFCLFWQRKASSSSEIGPFFS